MDGRSKHNQSYWYTPGDWKLPRWWTAGPPVRTGHKATYQELEEFYTGPFVVNVLGHTGGMTTPPALEEKENG